MGRPKNNDYPPYMKPDGDRGGFVVKNPITGKRKRFTEDQEEVARATAVVLAELIEKDRQAKLLDAGRPTISKLIEGWKRDRLQFMPWDGGTRDNFVTKLNRIDRELGARVVVSTDCTFIETWISSFTRTADTFNDWRHVFFLLWRYAVSRKLAAENEGDKVEPRSTSKKLEANQKVRKPLDVYGFKAIYAKARPWLQIAMEQSLVTLQGRSEICNMQHSHYRSGFLFVIREKTSGDSDMAFIKIELTPELEEIRSRALKLDSIASPFLVHRAPAKRQERWTKSKPHWTYVNPDYLSKALAAAREASGHYKHLEPDERPSFHEIRGLGARLYEEAGVSKKAISALMTHSDKKVTEIYLDQGPQALTDDDYKTVSAPMRLSKVLGSMGSN